ncbi:MAG: hypothetical protein KGQ54_00315 [Verrucomicrobia bacterium]|nr:hypothetical protein [Verrucomicrobiota bacterium]NDE63220.1 hypothetical protein [Chlamydiota bacterium]
MSLLTQIGVYLTVACAAFNQVAQAPADTLKSQELSNWKTVRSKRCTLKMPSTPYSSSHTNQVRGEQFNYDVLVAPVDNRAVYILLVAEYPRAIPKNNQQASLEQFLTWISSQNPENRLDRASLIRHQGHEGLDFVIKNGSICFSGRLVIAESRVYLLAVECEENQVKNIPLSAYVDSLDLF